MEKKEIVKASTSNTAWVFLLLLCLTLHFTTLKKGWVNEQETGVFWWSYTTQMESIKGRPEKNHFLTEVSARLSGPHDNKSIALKRKEGEEERGAW